jgi:uncharacterized protein GlcG (DUF336 family)
MSGTADVGPVVAAPSTSVDLGDRLLERVEISATVAEELARQAVRHASGRGIAFSIAVTDRGGELVVLYRMDGASAATTRLATAKAWTACALGLPTEIWGRETLPEGSSWGLPFAAGGAFTALGGGIPARLGSVLVGAIGVSGGSIDDDIACARAALEAIGFEVS